MNSDPRPVKPALGIRIQLKLDLTHDIDLRSARVVMRDRLRIELLARSPDLASSTDATLARTPYRRSHSRFGGRTEAGRQGRTDE